MQFYGYSVEKIPKIPCFRLKIGPKWSKSANFTKIDTFRQFPGGLGGNQQFFQAQFWSLFQVRVVVGGCFWTRNGSKRPKTVENGPKMAKTTPFYSISAKLISPHFGTLCYVYIFFISVCLKCISLDRKVSYLSMVLEQLCRKCCGNKIEYYTLVMSM